MDQEKTLVILKDYIQLLRKEGITVKKAFLYGSFSKNTHSESSDIDLLLVSDEYNETDDQMAGKIWQLTRKINTKIEPYIISSRRFDKEDSSPLINLVKKEGIEIVL